MPSGSVWVTTLVSYPAGSLTSLMRFEDSPCTVSGFNSPHDVQETAFNDWWEQGHSSVSAFPVKSPLAWDPTRSDFQLVRAEVPKRRREQNFSHIAPRCYLTAKCTQAKLSIYSRDQMMLGFSWIHVTQQRDLYLHRDVNSDESCFCNGNIYKNCCAGYSDV